MDGSEKATRNQPSAASFDVGFSPGGTALIVVEKAISAAHSEILMACYEFTSRDIAEALEPPRIAESRSGSSLIGRRPMTDSRR